MNLFWFVCITDALYLFYTCVNATMRSIRESVGRYMLCPGDICYAKKHRLIRHLIQVQLTCDKNKQLIINVATITSGFILLCLFIY